MDYQTYCPSKHLRPFVSRYFIIEDTGKQNDAVTIPMVMPNGIYGLGFSYREPFWYRRADGFVCELSSANLICMHSVPYTSQWIKEVGMLVVLFHPLGLSRLIREDMSPLCNTMVPLADIGFRAGEDVCGRLLECPTHHEKIQYIEEWLGRQLLTNTNNPPALVGSVLERIVRGKGLEPIRGIVVDEGANNRYVERYFSRYVGLSPKSFAEIIRFNYLISEILFKNDLSLDEMVFMGGFVDKSHLIRHFSKISLMTPSQFLAYLTEGSIAKFTNQHNAYLLFDGK